MLRKLLCIAFVTFALLSFHQAAADETTDATTTVAAANDAEEATAADESSTDDLPHLLDGLDWESIIEPQDIQDAISPLPNLL